MGYSSDPNQGDPSCHAEGHCGGVNHASGGGEQPVLRAAGDKFPTLGGYVTTVPRNSAHVVLVSPRGDPILAQWQHGLGRSVAWTSDSEGRWTSVFNTWKGVPVFWSALVNWTMPPEETTFQVRGEVEAGMAALAVEGEVQADGRLYARIVGPQLDVINIPVEATAPGHFEAEFPANEQGPYMVQVVEEAPGSDRRFTAASLVVPYSPEYRDLAGQSSPVGASGSRHERQSPQQPVRGPLARVCHQRTATCQWPGGC